MSRSSFGPGTTLWMPYNQYKWLQWCNKYFPDIKIMLFHIYCPRCLRLDLFFKAPPLGPCRCGSKWAVLSMFYRSIIKTSVVYTEEVSLLPHRSVRYRQNLSCLCQRAVALQPHRPQSPGCRKTFIFMGLRGIIPCHYVDLAELNVYFWVEWLQFGNQHWQRHINNKKMGLKATEMCKW